jgi:hypothetical protein
MFKATARVHFALAVALCLCQAILVNECAAQGVRGTVKGRDNGRVFDQAHVLALDSDGREVGSATTDDKGHFLLRLKSYAKPIVISILRIGIAPTKSDPMTFSVQDSSEYEFLVDEDIVRTDTMHVRERVLANERSLTDAKRRGWQLFTPEEVKRHRDTAYSLRDLVQSMAGLGIIIPNRDGDCFRSTRNNKCLTLVIDGRPVGTTYGIAPVEIYFMALVSKSDAATQWGSENVPNGALVIVTRMHGDRYK